MYFSKLCRIYFLSVNAMRDSTRMMKSETHITRLHNGSNYFLRWLQNSFQSNRTLFFQTLAGSSLPFSFFFTISRAVLQDMVRLFKPPLLLPHRVEYLKFPSQQNLIKKNEIIIPIVESNNKYYLFHICYYFESFTKHIITRLDNHLSGSWQTRLLSNFPRLGAKAQAEIAMLQWEGAIPVTTPPLHHHISYQNHINGTSCRANR